MAAMTTSEGDSKAASLILGQLQDWDCGYFGNLSAKMGVTAPATSLTSTTAQSARVSLPGQSLTITTERPLSWGVDADKFWLPLCEFWVPQIICQAPWVSPCY